MWEKGKIDPSDDEITKMCPILRIHKEDFLERDILAERTNANSKMKRGQHRSNYDWYYGNRLNMAFYVSYLILIPIIMIVTFILVGNIFDASLEQEMMEELSSKSDFPIILGGDFNSKPDNSIIGKLEAAGFVRTNTDPKNFTIPSNAPNREIDYIAYRPLEYFNVVSHTVVTGVNASDHLPIISVMKISKP